MGMLLAPRHFTLFGVSIVRTYLFWNGKILSNICIPLRRPGRKPAVDCWPVSVGAERRGCLASGSGEEHGLMSISSSEPSDSTINNRLILRSLGCSSQNPDEK